MSSTKKYPYIVPRSFRLRQELEFAEKGPAASESKTGSNSNKTKDPNAMWISFGLGDLDDSGYDNQLSNWNGTIIGPQGTPLGDRIYTIKLKCGSKYPDVAPTVQFVTKINMPGVDERTGLVKDIMKGWTRNSTMYDYLSAIRNSMTAAAKLKQPGPEETF